MKKLLINIISESEISVRGHGVHTAYLEMTKALRKQPGCKVVINQFSTRVPANITHIHTIGFHAWKKLLFGSGKKVVSVHVVPDSMVGSFMLAKYWRFAALIYMRLFYQRADLLLAVSRTVARDLEENLKIPKSKIQIMHNTIDMKQYAFSKTSKNAARVKLNINAETKVVLSNGQIQPRKRFDTFLAAATALPQVQFIWVGGIPFKRIGAEYSRMQQYIASIPDNVTVTGVIEIEDVRHYLAAADIFMLPSDQENHPMAVLEAAGASLPIILRDISEYEDTFAGDALYCQTDDEFIAAVKTLLDSSKQYKKYVRKSHHIARRFDSEENATRLEGIYRELLADVETSSRTASQAEES